MALVGALAWRLLSIRLLPAQGDRREPWAELTDLAFDEEVVRPMWVWQSISEEARREGHERLAADLKSGAEERYGHLRELDVGLRLVVSELNRRI